VLSRASQWFCSLSLSSVCALSYVIPLPEDLQLANHLSGLVTEYLQVRYAVLRGGRDICVLRALISLPPSRTSSHPCLFPLPSLTNARTLSLTLYTPQVHFYNTGDMRRATRDVQKVLYLK
jgi:hypothetical protein